MAEKSWGYAYTITPISFTGCGGGGGGQDGCERRIEVFVNIQKKKIGGGRVGGVRVDVIEELKFL